MINKKISEAIERVIRAYYKGETDATLAALVAESEAAEEAGEITVEEDLDEFAIEIFRNIIRDIDSKSSQHYELDVSGCCEAGDGSQNADCYRDRRGLWVVNGEDVSRGIFRLDR